MSHTISSLTDITADLIAEADTAMAKYPQYRGHYDGWVAIRARRDIKVRGLVAVVEGEYVLMDPASIHTVPKGGDANWLKRSWGKTFATFYLPRHLSGCDTVLRVDDFDTAI